jgi:hypothetical protein
MITSSEARGPWHDGPSSIDHPPSHGLADWAARCWPWSQSQRTDAVLASGTMAWLGWDGWVATARPDDRTPADADQPS